MSNISFLLNTSKAYTHNKLDLDIPVSIFVVSFSILLNSVGVVLNSIALCGIKRTHEKNATLTLLRNHSIMDILSGIFVIYDCIMHISGIHNLYECAFRYGGMVGVTVAAGVLIFGLNMERYVKIIFPLKYETYMTPKVVTAFVTFAWLISFGHFTNAIVKQLTNINKDHIKKCKFFAVYDGPLLLIVSINMFTMLGLQIFMYLHILCIAVSKIKTDLRRQYTVNGRRQQSFRIWWKPYKVVFLFVGVNFLGISPIGIFYILVQTGALAHYSKSQLGAMLSGIVLPMYMIRIVNPFLYSMQISEVKKTFMSVFGCCRKNRIDDHQ